MSKNGIRRYLVGHRGAGNSAPGSTHASLEKAVELGLKWVEYDVRITKDGHLVIANADDLFDCSGQNVKISESTLNELSAVNVGHSFSGTDEFHPVPLFEDAVKFCIDNGIQTQIELKGENETEEKLAKYVVESLSQEHMQFAEGKDPLITSFSTICLKAINKHSNNSLDTGLLIHTHLSDDWEKTANEVNPKYVHFYGGTINNGTRLTDKFAQSVQKAGYRLNAYRVNTPDDAQAAIAAGVNRFTSDEPEILTR